MRETRNPYEPHTHEVIEAYTTVQAANWGLMALRRTEDSDSWELWKEKYDANGCLTLSTEGGEEDELELSVQRVPVASVPHPPQSEARENEEDVEEDDDISDELPSSEEEDYDEEEGEEGEEGEKDEFAWVKQAQRRGGRPQNCQGCGCGQALCTSCWPQTEEEWKDTFG